MYLKVHPENPQVRHLNRAVEILRNNGIIIYPTDTVYGIGCSIYSKHAIEKVYQLKNQNQSKPFSFICSDLSNISEYAFVSNQAYRIMKHLIPGPYTFIHPANRLKQLPKSLISKRKTVGIRVPNNKIALAIVKLLGHPILSASLTDRQGNVINNPEIILKEFEKKVDLILDGGINISETSTVLDFTQDPPIIVRKGAGDLDKILSLCEK